MAETEKDHETEGMTKTDGGADEAAAQSGADAAASSEASEAAIHELEAQLEEAQREKDQFRALLQRTQADFVNYRKRMQAEQDGIRRNAVRPLILRILDSMDSFDAALDPDLIRDVDERWVEGVRAIRRSFEAILTDAGVERFEAKGESFDPRFHEALIRTETDSMPQDTVIRAMRAGYKIGDDVLRPALVEVSVLPETGEGASSEG